MQRSEARKRERGQNNLDEVEDKTERIESSKLINESSGAGWTDDPLCINSSAYYRGDQLRQNALNIVIAMASVGCWLKT